MDEQQTTLDGFAQAAATFSKPGSKLKIAGSPPDEAAKKKAAGNEAVQIISYRHPDRRKNNPEVAWSVKATDRPSQLQTAWFYDHHLDPAL